MKYSARKFNQDSYNTNDGYAKSLFIEFIKDNGHHLVSEVETYNHDIVTMKDGVTYFFELEVKRNYPFTDQESYKFDTVSFLGRKKRLHLIQPFYYVIICKETEWFVMCESNVIFKDEYIEELTINTTDRKGKDQMYRVPKDKCKFYNIKSNGDNNI